MAVENKLIRHVNRILYEVWYIVISSIKISIICMSSKAHYNG